MSNPQKRVAPTVGRKDRKNNVYPEVASKFFLETGLVQRVDRKHWNKAVELINNYNPRKRADFCLRHTVNSRINAKKSCKYCRIVSMKLITSALSNEGIKRGHILILLLEIRQALLRHDWKKVHRIHMSLMDAFISHWRSMCTKVMVVSLLASPMSDWEIVAEFCRMATGMNDSEMKTFVKTLKKLPNEIPRGFLKVLNNTVHLKGEVDLPSDAYMRASLAVRGEESDDGEMDLD